MTRWLPTLHVRFRMPIGALPWSPFPRGGPAQDPFLALNFEYPLLPKVIRGSNPRSPVQPEWIQRYLAHAKTPAHDPAVGLCLGPYGGPRGGGAISYERGIPVDHLGSNSFSSWGAALCARPVFLYSFSDGPESLIAVWGGVLCFYWALTSSGTLTGSPASPSSVHPGAIHPRA